MCHVLAINHTVVYHSLSISWDDFTINTSMASSGISQPAVFDDTRGYLVYISYNISPVLVTHKNIYNIIYIYSFLHTHCIDTSITIHYNTSQYIAIHYNTLQ